MKILFSVIILLALLACNSNQSNQAGQDAEVESQQDELNNSTKETLTRLQFSIEIQADESKIWKALWEDENYRDWTSLFYEGSYYLADSWEVGGEIMFLAPDRSGIYSIIETYVPNKIVQFKHIGSVLDGKKQPIDQEAKKWSGAKESYSLKEGVGFITLIIEIDVLNEHIGFMSTRIPLALERIKENCS